MPGAPGKRNGSRPGRCADRREALGRGQAPPAGGKRQGRVGRWTSRAMEALLMEFGSEERWNGTYIYDVPSFLRERNGLRYKGTVERHIYIGGSRGEFGKQALRRLISTLSPESRRGYPAHARGQRQTVFGGGPRGGRGPRISGTLEGVGRGHIALVRPQVLKTISGAIHGQTRTST